MRRVSGRLWQGEGKGDKVMEGGSLAGWMKGEGCVVGDSRRM